MKDVTIRYTLRSNKRPLDKRNGKEKVYAEFSAAFKRRIGGLTIYDKFQFSLEVSVQPQHFGNIKRIIKEKK